MTTTKGVTTKAAGGNQVDSILLSAAGQLGVKYGWGDEDPGTDFDCSGLTQWAYEQAGISIPRSSQAQFNTMQAVSAADAKAGDLVFTAGSDGTMSQPGHVGIYLGNGEVLQSPHTGADVDIVSLAQFGPIAGFRTAPQLVGQTSNLTSIASSLPGNTGTSALSDLEDAGSVVSGAVSWTTELGNIFDDITSNWNKVVAILIGLVCIMVAIYILFHSQINDAATVAAMT